jgi:bifunctional non-homologous end joining protein LigD
MTTLAEYVEQKRSGKKIPTGIRERWQTRVVPRGLHVMGEAGARQYLADYGRGIAAPKVIDLARQAEAEGYPEMALEFWRRAYELEIGHLPPAEGDVDLAVPSVPAGNVFPTSAGGTPQVKDLPSHLQPGCIHTMQPVDAPLDREEYITDPAYWGQPKKDGCRTVVVATPEMVWYQSRSTNLQEVPSLEMDAVLREAAAGFGAFVLDAELYYRDALGGEHRTGAQAATVNVRAGYPGVHPQPRLAIFKALYADGQDLTSYPESERIEAGAKIGYWLETHSAGFFEVLPTCRTEAAKRSLAARQQAEGREGEVWVRHGCLYRGGKDNGNGGPPPFVRTKYLKELDVVVLALSSTTAADRPFGAVEVGIYENGKIISLGSVGTGFTHDQMAELARRHDETPGQVVITIVTQGFTEGGKVMHGRFTGFRGDKLPRECVL